MNAPYNLASNKLAKRSNFNCEVYTEAEYSTRIFFNQVMLLLGSNHSLMKEVRIEFKILLLTYKDVKGFASGYITELINIKNEGRCKLCSNSKGIFNT